MKAKYSFVILLMATIVLSSCNMKSLTSPSTPSSNTSTAYTSGKGFGSSFAALYAQYKSSGKVDFTNPTTLINITSLATYGATIKGSAKNSTTYKDFTAGTIAGSNGLINTKNVDNIISTINSLDLAAIVTAINNKSISSGTITSINNTLIKIFSTLGK